MCLSVGPSGLCSSSVVATEMDEKERGLETWVESSEFSSFHAYNNFMVNHVFKIFPDLTVDDVISNIYHGTFLEDTVACHYGLLCPQRSEDLCGGGVMMASIGFFPRDLPVIVGWDYLSERFISATAFAVNSIAELILGSRVTLATVNPVEEAVLADDPKTTVVQLRLFDLNGKLRNTFLRNLRKDGIRLLKFYVGNTHFLRDEFYSFEFLFRVSMDNFRLMLERSKSDQKNVKIK